MSEEDKGQPPAPGERMDLPTWDHSRTKRRGGAGGPQEDAFVTGVKQVGQQAVRRGRFLVVAVVAVVVVVVGVVLLYSQRLKSSAASSRLLAEAARFESEGEIGDPALLLGANRGKPVAPILKDEAERAAKINEALDALGPSAGDAALTGLLVRAGVHMRAGEAGAAETLYRDFLGRSSAGHPLRYAAREGLAFAREAQGDEAGALVELEALAGEKGTFYREMALWHRGRILERQGKPEAALEVYRQYIAEFPLQQPSLAQAEVRARLEELDPKALAGVPDSSPIQVFDGPPGGVP